MTDKNDFEMTWPGKGMFAVTPSDETNLAQTPRAIWVGTQGNLSVEMMDGSSGVFENASGWLPIRPRKVLATGTTATGIAAVY